MAVEHVGSERKRGALALFKGLEQRYDLGSSLLSLGQDPRWRAAMVASVGAAPDDRVLDVATGTALVARALVRRYGCSVVGLDQSAAMLAGARIALADHPELAPRIELIQGEAERLPFADRDFDHLTFTYLLRYVDDPLATLRGLARVVKPGGSIAMLEFGLPRGIWRPLWDLYVGVGLPTAGRLISPGWHEVGRFLGPSIRDFHARHPSLPALFREAGIADVHERRLSLGGGLVVWGRKA